MKQFKLHAGYFPRNPSVHVTLYRLSLSTCHMVVNLTLFQSVGENSNPLTQLEILARLSSTELGTA